MLWSLCMQLDNYINGTWQPIGRYCGDTVPPSVKTSHNKLRLKFHSDASQNFAGFSLSYTTGKQSYCECERVYKGTLLHFCDPPPCPWCKCHHVCFQDVAKISPLYLEPSSHRAIPSPIATTWTVTTTSASLATSSSRWRLRSHSSSKVKVASQLMLMSKFKLINHVVLLSL